MSKLKKINAKSFIKNSGKNVLLAFISLTILNSCGVGDVQFKQGKKLYEVHCESCHMVDGSGLGANIPPLAISDYLEERQESIACLIKYGTKDTMTVNGVIYTEQMAGNPNLNEFEMTNIINYINHAWGNDFGFITIEKTRENLGLCE